MSNGMSMFSADRELIICNRRFCEIYDLPDELRQPGISLDTIQSHTHALRVTEDQNRNDDAAIRTLIAAGTPVRRLRELKNGRVVAVDYQPMGDGGWVSTHTDITEQERDRARIYYLARHDALTSLPNRLMFQDELQKVLSRLDARGFVAVHCLDLDQFKQVNDTLGHLVGDLLLKTVAERIGTVLGRGDLVARWGGDEFAIIQTACAGHAEAAALAKRVVDVCRQPHHIAGHHIVVGASLGIAVAPEDTLDPDLLLRNADLALYRAKANGRGCFCFFEPFMDETMQQRRQLELELREAIDLDQFELHFQPIQDLETGVINAFEALIRWNHPTRGQILPGEFIGLAEETGLIRDIGLWVIREACQEAAQWPPHVSVAVNISAAQLMDVDLASRIVAALSYSGLAPHRLEIEITETAIIGDTDRALRILADLREVGIRVALDDFGTGYSSLSFLAKFPFDRIKIDRSFVCGGENTGLSLAIVRAIAALGVSLGVPTTAEGVETLDQLNAISLEGCSQGQGWYFGRPLPSTALQALLSTTQPAPGPSSPARLLEACAEG